MVRENDSAGGGSIVHACHPPISFTRLERVRGLLELLVAITGFFTGATKADEPEPY